MKKIYSLFLLFLFSSILPGDFFPGLSELEMKTLLSGKLIVKTKKIKAAPWPEVTIFSVIKATPLISISVFTAYNEHKDFIPDLLCSKIVKEVSKTNVHIAFEIDIPWPLSNSKHVSGNILSKKVDGSYQVEWYFVKSDSSKGNYGKIIFSPYKNITLLKYQNFTHPNSSLAKLFKKKMINKTKETVIAIKNRIEKIKNFEKLKLEAYIIKLKNKLSLN